MCDSTNSVTSVWSVVAANDSGRIQQDGGNVSADASAAGFKFLELWESQPQVFKVR